MKSSKVTLAFLTLCLLSQLVGCGREASQVKYERAKEWKSKVRDDGLENRPAPSFKQPSIAGRRNDTGQIRADEKSAMENWQRSRQQTGSDSKLPPNGAGNL